MSDESALQFPCEFPIKMMGRDTPEFRVTARALVEKHAGAVDDGAVQMHLADTPLHLLNKIEAEAAKIERIESELSQLEAKLSNS